MADDAYYGITGEVVKTIEPHSEGDPVALMLQFLTLAGNVIGRLPSTKLSQTTTTRT